MPAYKDTKTGKWYVKFRQKDWKGKTKNIMKRGFTTKHDALQWETSYKQREEGTTDMTFKDFITVYKADIGPRLRESTWVTKESIIDKKLMPGFADKKMNDITPADVVHWQNEMMKEVDPKTGKAYSRVYLKTMQNQLSAIFNFGMRFYGLKSNPARIAGGMGSEDAGEMKFWTQEEYRKFAEVMMANPIAYYSFEMLYWTGIREGELLALTWEDIDLDARTVSVTKTYQKINGKELVTDPKTPTSRRVVTMPEFLCDELRDYLKMDYAPKKGERVFPITKSLLNKQIVAGAEKAGVKRIRVHDLRHSHISLLINMGVSPVAIAKRVGHKSIYITYHYAHVFPSVQGQIANQLDALNKEEQEDD